jgi:hypothetical protein
MTYEQRKAWAHGIIIGLMGAVVAVGVSNKMRDAANECAYRPSAFAKAVLGIDTPTPPACAKAKVAPLALTK